MDHADPQQAADPAAVVVEVSDTQSHLRIDPEAVVRLVRDALAAEGVARASISVAIVDDPSIRAINRRHLGHDWATDVITFPLSEPDDPVLSGELVVSAETAARAAGRAGLRVWDELALYLVHGLLHLRGHDDADAADALAMRRRESEVLAALGIGDAFARGAAADDDGPGGAAP